MARVRYSLALAGALALAASGATAQESATASMVNRDGEAVGTVSLKSTKSGLVHIIVEVSGIPAGPHGFHIHETGQCDPEGGFESAGGHFAGDMEHGVMVDGGPHPGDFPNVHAFENEVVKAEFFTDRITLGDGENSVMDEDGSAVMIHAGPDDYESQPSGDAGDRIACGVIE